MGHQKYKKNGTAITHYFLNNETKNNWTQMINIQFKDKAHLKGASAEEVIQQEAKRSSTQVKSKVHVLKENDIIYERQFPTGEYELVRIIITEKGLHRVAYVKKSGFTEEERKQWKERLAKAHVGGEPKKKESSKKKTPSEKDGKKKDDKKSSEEPAKKEAKAKKSKKKPEAKKLPEKPVEKKKAPPTKKEEESEEIPDIQLEEEKASQDENPSAEDLQEEEVEVEESSGNQKGQKEEKELKSGEAEAGNADTEEIGVLLLKKLMNLS